MGIRYDSGRYLTARGEGLLTLGGRLGEAEDVLDEASLETAPDLTRRHLFIDLQKTRLCIVRKEYLTATVLAQEVVSKAKAVESLYSFKSLQEITTPLFESTYGKSDDVKELLLTIKRAK